MAKAGGVDIQVKTIANHLTGARQSALRSAAKAAVRKNLQDIQRYWADDVRVDTSELKDSILEESAIRIEANGLEGTVGTDVLHAAPNEYGAPTISARPSARQAAEKARPEFEAEMARITRELEK